MRQPGRRLPISSIEMVLGAHPGSAGHVLPTLKGWRIFRHAGRFAGTTSHHDGDNPCRHAAMIVHGLNSQAAGILLDPTDTAAIGGGGIVAATVLRAR